MVRTCLQLFADGGLCFDMYVPLCALRADCVHGVSNDSACGVHQMSPSRTVKQ